METTAIIRGVHISAQKTRLVADLIRGKKVGQALNILTFSPKKAAAIMKKAVESAIANAEHNEGADIDELKVTTIFVDKAQSLKRFTARAKGRGNRIEKQTCHITVKVGASNGVDRWVRKFIPLASASRSPVTGPRVGSPTTRPSAACWPKTSASAST